jgi:hypothetical protein
MTVEARLPEVADEDHGGAIVRIECDLDGMFDHFELGHRWGTSAYDELDDCLHDDGAPDAPSRWVR